MTRLRRYDGAIGLGIAAAGLIVGIQQLPAIIGEEGRTTGMIFTGVLIAVAALVAALALKDFVRRWR